MAEKYIWQIFYVVCLTLLIRIAFKNQSSKRRLYGYPISVAPSAERVIPKHLDKLVDYLLEEGRKRTGVNLRDDELAQTRIIEAAQSAFEALKASRSYLVKLPFISATVSGPQHLEILVTKDQV